MENVPGGNPPKSNPITPVPGQPTNQQPLPVGYRTDRNNNPTAFTTDIAKEAGLVVGTDYVVGDSFTIQTKIYYTAKLLGDPVAITKKVINKIGFYSKGGYTRWVYIGIPDFVWNAITDDEQTKVIGFMYGKEGGVQMKGLFT
jgi:hypothetical protein